jgi:NADPH:quinone reductase-like Zn-dependent oxidoreductase
VTPPVTGMGHDLPSWPFRRVTAGDTVLTQGSGGVSVFALQFARILGARVIATTSTADKAERLRALGASDVINYTEMPDWDAEARELTDGRGVDCVVEIAGPATIAKSLKALAVGGHVSLIGASLSPPGTMLDPLLLTGRGITVGAISVGSRADFEEMNRAIALHRLLPVIDRTASVAKPRHDAGGVPIDRVARARRSVTSASLI